MIKLSKYLFYIFSFTYLMKSCSSEDINQIATLDYNGRVTKFERLGRYSRVEAIQFLGLVNPKYKVETTCGFELYRVSYKTTDFRNKEVIVSGLLGVPETKKIKGLVSWQHGTNTYRAGSVSQPSPDEGIGVASLFSGNQYLLLAPDYIGLGVSHDVHPYYHVKSTTNAVVDFLKIGEIVLNFLTHNQNSKLFLTGFSQGGGATIATQRAIELTNPTQLKLIATAPIAGAFNLRNISLPHTLQRRSINSMVYFGYLVNAYSIIYNKPLQSFVKEPYASNIQNWFDGSKDAQFMINNLTDNLKDLFLEEFYNELENNSDNWFTNALDENEMYQWKPISKIRFYFGLMDEDVTPKESLAAYDYMKILGGNVELYPLGPFNHEESILEALPKVQEWFNKQ